MPRIKVFIYIVPKKPLLPEDFLPALCSFFISDTRKKCYNVNGSVGFESRLLHENYLLISIDEALNWIINDPAKGIYT